MQPIGTYPCLWLVTHLIGKPKIAGAINKVGLKFIPIILEETHLSICLLLEEGRLAPFDKRKLNSPLKFDKLIFLAMVINS